MEKAFLMLFFGTFLFIGCSNLFEHKLNHDFPYGYLASDSFQQQTRIEAIKDMGNYRNEPPYIVKGFKDVIGYYPPLIHHLGVLFSYVSGLQTYDSTYFFVFFMAAVASLIMYFSIKKYNKQIAIISLPLSLLIFSRAPFIGFVWGHWASLTGQFFLVACCWAFVNWRIRKSFILLGILLSGAAFAHTTEFVFLIMFVVFNSLFIFAVKKSSKQYLKTVVYAGIFCLVISGYSLLVFKNTFMAANSIKLGFTTNMDWGGTPLLGLTDFKILLVFIFLGILIFISSLKKENVVALFGLFMLGIGYTNYIGFEIRAFQSRFFWPVYFSVFFGIGLFYILKFFVKKWKSYYSVLIGILFILLFAKVFVPYVPHYDKITGPGIMDNQHWDTLTWFWNNSNKDATVYFFYGDIYGQDALLRNTKRVHFLISPKDYVAALNDRVIKRDYITEVPGDSGAGFPYKKGFLSFGLHKDDLDELHRNGNKDICAFDYYVFDKITAQPALAQYNLIMARELLKKEFIQLVHENQVSVILKNNKPGEDCIETRNI